MRSNMIIGGRLFRSGISLLFVLVLIAQFASALPQEAKGLVSHVSDGDTLTVQGTGAIRLADINSPELDAPGGPEAKEYTRTLLLDKQIYLDIDNKTGQDRYDRYVCIVYLINSDGSLGGNFNRMLVDSGHAIVEDARDNEFDPAQWWGDAKVQKSLSKDVKLVGSAKSDKYHYPDCQWARKIKPSNEIWFTSSEDARSKGYVPCGVCSPR